MGVAKRFQYRNVSVRTYIQRFNQCLNYIGLLATAVLIKGIDSLLTNINKIHDITVTYQLSVKTFQNLSLGLMLVEFPRSNGQVVSIATRHPSAVLDEAATVIARSLNRTCREREAT